MQSAAKGGAPKGKSKKSAESPRGDNEIFLAMHKTDQRYETLRFLLFLPSLAIPVLAGIPIAKVLAGTQTDINVRLTATLGVTLVGVMALATLLFNYQRRTISDLRRDNKALRSGLMPPVAIQRPVPSEKS